MISSPELCSTTEVYCKQGGTNQIVRYCDWKEHFIFRNWKCVLGSGRCSEILARVSWQDSNDGTMMRCGGEKHIQVVDIVTSQSDPFDDTSSNPNFWCDIMILLEGWPRLQCPGSLIIPQSSQEEGWAQQLCKPRDRTPRSPAKNNIQHPRVHVTHQTIQLLNKQHLVGSLELTMVTIASWKVLLSPKSLTSILDMVLKLRLKTASLWQKPFEFQGTAIWRLRWPVTSTKSSSSMTLTSLIKNKMQNVSYQSFGFWVPPCTVAWRWVASV